MGNTLNLQRLTFILGVPLLLMGVLIGIMQPNIFDLLSPSLTLGITLDLLITIPLVYFLLIRKTSIPKTTVMFVLIIGTVVGTIMLPQESQGYLDIFKSWFLPVLELGIFVGIGIQLKKGIQVYKENQSNSFDFYTVVKATTSQILPSKLALPFATEIAVIYYGFIHWKTVKLKENEFSYHQKNGTVSLMFGFILVIIIETFVLHHLIAKWNIIVAWGVTALSFYSIFQIIGIAKSLMKRPIEITDRSLVLRYGILNEVEIQFEDIIRVELNKQTLSNTEIKQLSPLGEFDSHNCILYLNKEHTLIGLYGIKTKCEILALHVDDDAQFKMMLDQHI
jgi:hypothetical protein